MAASMGHDEACTILLDAGATVDAPVLVDRTLAGISRTVRAASWQHRHIATHHQTTRSAPTCR